LQETLLKYQLPASERSNLEEYIDEHKLLTNWKEIEHEGWRLPAIKEPHYWCGTWKTMGCINTEFHNQMGFGRRTYVKQFQRSCYRGSCKVCYQKWIAREANKATRRIEAYSNLSKENPIHILLSVPPNQYHVPVSVLRKKMSKIIKDINLKGALIIFHPFKFRSKERQFYYAPHFHLIGFGYSSGISEAFGKHGWFIKNLGVRKSVFQTISYLMSHCGIRKGNHTVTWVGRLSYSKLKLEKEPPHTHCPCCGAKFVEIYCNDIEYDIPPDRPFEGLVEYGEWHLVLHESQDRIF